MAEVDEKIALITGANKGIGFEIARQLGIEGVHVIVGARNAERGKAAVNELRKAGIVADFVLLDVTDDGSVKSALHDVRDRFGHLDILVNNAGTVENYDQEPSALHAATYQLVYDTNVFGPVRVTNAALPLLRQAAAARIVNVSSMLGSLQGHAVIDGTDSSRLMEPYNSSKAALNRLMLDYANELADTPIKINNVCPGFVDTDLTSQLGGSEHKRTPEQGARIAVRMALLPEDGPTGSFQDDNGSISW